MWQHSDDFKQYWQNHHGLKWSLLIQSISTIFYWFSWVWYDFLFQNNCLHSNTKSFLMVILIWHNTFDWVLFVLGKAQLFSSAAFFAIMTLYHFLMLLSGVEILIVEGECMYHQIPILLIAFIIQVFAAILYTSTCFQMRHIRLRNNPVVISSSHLVVHNNNDIIIPNHMDNEQHENSNEINQHSYHPYNEYTLVPISSSSSSS
jgi:hypothetical protein